MLKSKILADTGSLPTLFPDGPRRGRTNRLRRISLADVAPAMALLAELTTGVWQVHQHRVQANALKVNVILPWTYL